MDRPDVLSIPISVFLTIQSLLGFQLNYTSIFVLVQYILIVPLCLQHIIDSMKDPSIGAFWLITLPQVMGGIEYDDEVKQKIWQEYSVRFYFLCFQI